MISMMYMYRHQKMSVHSCPANEEFLQLFLVKFKTRHKNGSTTVVMNEDEHQYTVLLYKDQH